MDAEAVHRLMACNYRGVIKALVSLLIGKAPAVQTPPANGCRQESACDGAERVAGTISLPLAQLAPFSAPRCLFGVRLGETGHSPSHRPHLG